MLFLLAVCLGAPAALSLDGRLRGRLYNVIVDVASWIVNAYLLFAKPIYSVDGSSTIPTCDYRWPNGQGDIGKFLDGEKNSERWNQEHGHVYRIWSGTTPEIVVGDPNHLQAIFKDSDKHMKAVNNDAGWMMGELLGKCLGLIGGDAWRRLHTAISVPFTHKNARTYLPQIDKAIEVHFDKMKTSGTLKRGLLHPVDDLRFLPFWIVAEILYGELTVEQRKKLEDIIPLREELFKRIIQGGLTRFPISRHLPTDSNSKLRQFNRMWVEFNEEIYQANKNQDSFLVSLYQAVQNGSITLDQLLQTLDEMLFANLDVTMGGLSWNLLFLASHTEVQDAIRAEWRSRAESQDTTKAWEEYINSPSTLLAASILESGRLKPLAAFSVPQSAPTDRVVGGYRIPAGTNFVVDTHALNIRNPFWGQDRDQYRPSRFLERKSLEMRYQYWRFGFGPRQCLGKYVVELVIRSILAHLLATHRLSLHETTHWDKNAEVWIAHPNTEICCVPLES